MTQEVRIDYDKRTVTPLRAPHFYLVAAHKCTRDGGMSSKAELQWDFSERDFGKLVEAEWDFQRIGISIVDSPVDNFRISEAMARAPMYPIKLLPSN
jgi:hypothetical protein